MKEKPPIRHLLSSGMIAIALVGCNGALTLNRNYTYYGSESLKTPEIITHETHHQEQMRQMGEDIFWQNYLLDSDFRCAAEVDAGLLSEDHFACYGKELDTYTPERIQEIFEKAKQVEFGDVIYLDDQHGK